MIQRPAEALCQAYVRWAVVETVLPDDCATLAQTVGVVWSCAQDYSVTNALLALMAQFCATHYTMRAGTNPITLV